MQFDARSEQLEAVAAHPLAELLECPAGTGSLLDGTAQCLPAEAGQIIFRQQDPCKGLYVVVSGSFQRRAERHHARLNLGTARPGDLLELAAALGDGHHTCSLVAQTAGSLLLLPMDGLTETFRLYPPLRMRLLEELAREVSRAYLLSGRSRPLPPRRCPAPAPTSSVSRLS